MSEVALDASVALAWVLPTEASDASMVLRNRARDTPALYLLVPATFWFEVASALWVAVRRARLSAGEARAALDALLLFSIETWTVEPTHCLNLAFDRSVAVYDAACLAVAGDAECPLWTLDARLGDAAAALGIPVEP